MAYLEVNIGPMFSGKSTHLIHSVHRFMDVHKNSHDKSLKVVFINWYLDDRDTKKVYKSNITTHSSCKKELNAEIVNLKAMFLSEINWNDFDIIAIDECQFYLDLVEEVKKMLAKEKRIYLSGLIGDKDRNVFGTLVYLLPEANNINFHKAVCKKCFIETGGDESASLASFTCLNENSDNVPRYKIGGEDLYRASCRKHLNLKE